MSNSIIDPHEDETRKDYAERTEVDKTPQPKVIAATVGAGVGSAIANIVIYIIEASAKIDIPGEVEISAAVVVSAGIAFAAGYIKKN